MIWWSLGSTAAAALSLFLLVKTLQAKREAAAKHLDEMKHLAKQLAESEIELGKLRHVIQAQQEAMQHAAQEKRDIREHADPGDRARAATDKLRELAGGGDGNQDGTASTD